MSLEGVEFSNVTFIAIMLSYPRLYECYCEWLYSHSGNSKRIVDNCFKLHGYLDWWGSFNEQKSRDRYNQKDGDKRDAKAIVMVSPPSMLPSITQTSTLITTMPIGSNSDLQQNTQSSGNVRLALMSVDTIRDTRWIIDFGAIDHTMFDQSLSRAISKIYHTHVYNVNGTSSLVTSVDTFVTIRTHFTCSLSHSNNLLSMTQFCLLQDLSSKEIIRRGTKRRRLYYVNDIYSDNALTSQSSTCTKKHQIWMWHLCFGHASFRYIKHLFPSLFLDCNPLDFHCDVYTQAKSHRANYPLSFNMTIESFTLIHSNVWGLALVLTLSGYRWFVIFIDNCNRVTLLYLMTNKSDVYGCFYSFHKMIQTQFSNKDNGIIHETTCPYTSQQNCVTKRKIQHILKIDYTYMPD
ncbi:hypothetical protein CR513_15770, partial [Mucuna pruriens]